MENSFRFLINVDQCLNMSYFDMFFYKLESQHKFHMSSVQMFENSEDNSLRNAVTDIRMYLNKYPYHVGSYQIIVAMRSVFREHVSRWEDSMLYRLIRMDQELQRAHILINSQEQTEKALNLIMLYDADFSAGMAPLENYMESGRLLKDCVLLLQGLSLKAAVPSQEELEQAVAAYGQRLDHDETALVLLNAFLEKRRKDRSFITAAAAHPEAGIENPDSVPFPGTEPALALELAQFVRDQLFHFHIFEVQVDRNSRRQQILALLRVTEFINANTQAPAAIPGAAPMPLSQRCAGIWQKIWADQTLEKRYADMLHAYRARLHAAAQELENPRFCVSSAKDLPQEEIPAADAIAIEDELFAHRDSSAQKNDLKNILAPFLRHRFSLSSIQQEWNKAYKQCRQLLEHMEHQLKTYAENLSRQYAAVLEKRKQDSIQWRAGFYVAGPSTESDISHLAYEREQRLQQLKSPQMTPSLSFQDQLNMENALEQANLTMNFYLRCLSAVTAGNFLLLVALCALACFGHYTFLQPYVLQEGTSALCYLAYLGIILVLMLLCWLLPYSFFYNRMKRCIKALQADADKYISGYYTKADHFRTYINLLNQLDYITRYHRLLVQAHSASHKLSQGYLWHKVQVKHHLDKLQFFRGLAELGDLPADIGAGTFVPGTERDRVNDYIDSPLYWPQG